jgi:hypothetical protein
MERAFMTKRGCPPFATWDGTERRADEPFSEPGEGMMQAMMMQIQIRHLPALYIEAIMLGLPVLILANGLIDRIRGGDPHRGAPAAGLAATA